MLTSVLWTYPAHTSSKIPSRPSKNKFVQLQSVAAAWVYNQHSEEMFQGLWAEEGRVVLLCCDPKIWAKPLFWTTRLISTDSQNGGIPWKQYTSLTDVPVTLTVVAGAWLMDKNGFLDAESHHVPSCFRGDGQICCHRLWACLHVCDDMTKRSLWEIFRS